MTGSWKSAVGADGSNSEIQDLDKRVVLYCPPYAIQGRVLANLKKGKRGTMTASNHNRSFERQHDNGDGQIFPYRAQDFGIGRTNDKGEGSSNTSKRKRDSTGQSNGRGGASGSDVEGNGGMDHNKGDGSNSTGRDGSGQEDSDDRQSDEDTRDNQTPVDPFRATIRAEFPTSLNPRTSNRGAHAAIDVQRE